MAISRNSCCFGQDTWKLVRAGIAECVRKYPLFYILSKSISVLLLKNISQSLMESNS